MSVERTEPVVHVETRSSYADSVTLLQVSRRISGAAGVRAAFVAMGTRLNLDLALGMGFPLPDGIGANDLLIAIRADHEMALDGARSELEQALAPVRRPGSAWQREAPPRTTGAALRRAGAGLVLVSVPGQFALAEAVDALDAGSDVMVFSDNMAVQEEIALKRRAAESGRLVMGPDCGTAVVGGAGLGFANVVRPGPLGVVAASGTGAQQLLCLLDTADVGVTACLGVGGRDLSDAVGGLSTRRALDMLDADPATELIVVVSKPPGPATAAAIRAHCDVLSTPVVFGLLGRGEPDLTALAEKVLGRLERPVPAWPDWGSSGASRPGALRGLFSGGTLCDEAMLIAADALGPVYSNIAVRPDWALGPALRHEGHLMIDFGDDALTRGRPHPMIDPTLRLGRLAAETADPTAAVVLLDVVLGHGAHPDPAAELAAAIAAAVGAGLQVVVTMIGSRGDPQGTIGQAERLAAAGAAVFASNATATRHAVGLVQR